MNTFKLKKILVPTDFSELSLNAIDYAIILAKKEQAEINLVHISEEMLIYPISGEAYMLSGNMMLYEDELKKVKKEQLDKIAAQYVSSGVKFNTILRSGRSHPEIVKIVKEEDIDMIVMSTHGVSGVREFIIGSNAVRVISEAPCPVLSVQKKLNTIDNNIFKRILLQFRDQPHSREKVDYGIKLAQWFDSTLIVLGIDDTNTDEGRRRLTAHAEQIKTIATDLGVKVQTEVRGSGSVSKLILDYAEECEADLIMVMSDMDKSNISEYVMGPVAQRLVNRSKIPVISIRPTFNPNTINLHPYGW